VSLLAAPVFDPATWSALPFHFWTVVFFVFGTVVGSFLNVCIHRMPRGESLVRPPSHCPHCGTLIRWWQNIPIFAWLALRGRCAACGARISARYLAVEALTGAVFAWVWVARGEGGPLVAGAFCLFAAGLLVATFIDLEHLIIPDEITLGGTVVGIVLAVVVPGIHGAEYVWPSLKAAALGAGLGAGVVFGMLELGKLLFGRQRFRLPAGTRLVFTETELHLPDRTLPYEDVFYRVSDALTFHARSLELVDRCYANVTVQLRLRAGTLRIGEEEVDASTVLCMEGVADQVTVPREAMGFGDVKFMAAIGAFTGWKGVLFALLGSSLAGLIVNVGLIAVGRREWSARIPFGPYLAAAALGWVLGGHRLFEAWLQTLGGVR
jgi:leader peptidase (prepilin peptidase)/N-methyltransferase